MEHIGLQDLLLKHNKVAMLNRGFKTDNAQTQMKSVRLTCIRSRAVHAYAKKLSIVGYPASPFFATHSLTDGTSTDPHLRLLLLWCSIKWTLVLQSSQFSI
jgi:hypothetical protein